MAGIVNSEAVEQIARGDDGIYVIGSISGYNCLALGQVHGLDRPLKFLPVLSTVFAY